jgi:hypothetical protein
MMKAPVCVVHINADGNVRFMRGSDDIDLLVIDERTPSDRVYATSTVVGADVISKLIGNSHIGSAMDDRHESIKSRVISALNGASHLTAVKAS